MMNRFYHLLTHWRTKGSITPSSHFLVRRMVNKISYARRLHLLQLGFGNGVFTKELLKNMSADSTLTIFEVDPECRPHRLSDTRIRYVEASAEYIGKYVGTQKFDAILSTLPLGSLPQKTTTRILRAIKSHLKNKGLFLQYQYSLYSKKEITLIFGKEPLIDFEWRNVPPAFIYEVRK